MSCPLGMSYLLATPSGSVPMVEFSACGEDKVKIRSTKLKEQFFLFAKRISGRDPIIQWIWQKHAGPHDIRQLPGKGIALLPILDRAHHLPDCFVKLHQVGHAFAACSQDRKST